MEQINYSKKVLNDYYREELGLEDKGGFKGDWIVGLVLVVIAVVVFCS